MESYPEWLVIDIQQPLQLASPPFHLTESIPCNARSWSEGEAVDWHHGKPWEDPPAGHHDHDWQHPPVTPVTTKLLLVPPKENCKFQQGQNRTKVKGKRSISDLLCFFGTVGDAIQDKAIFVVFKTDRIFSPFSNEEFEERWIAPSREAQSVVVVKPGGRPLAVKKLILIMMLHTAGEASLLPCSVQAQQNILAMPASGTKGQAGH